MTRAKAKAPLERSEGMQALDRTRMTMSGFCAFPAEGSHGYCHEKLVATGHPCLCPCHDQEVPPTMEGFGTITLAEPPAEAVNALVPEHPKLARKKRSELPRLVNGNGTLSDFAAREDGVVVNARTGEPLDLVKEQEKVMQATLSKLAATVTLDLPILFYDDYIARGLQAGRVVKRLARNTRVELDQPGYQFLYADADKHVNGSAKDGADPNVVISARATLVALQKVEMPS